jgi:uncharacterized protein (TIGR00369 family)
MIVEDLIIATIKAGEIVNRTLAEKDVAGAQKVSSMCMVCGEDNPLSLHAQFLDMADGTLVATFKTTEEHQSYPGRVHGGIISAILDETIGRAVQTTHPEVFGVTMDLEVRFRVPVPLGVELKVVARVDKFTQMGMTGSGELLLPDGTVAAQAKARYAKLSPEQITGTELDDATWHDDPRTVPQQILA